jgi:hypothetical protein
MPNTTEHEVIRKLRERATRGELNGIDVTCRVTGGAPGEQLVDEEVHLSSSGPVKARLGTPAAAMRESSENLAAPEMQALLLQIGEGAGRADPAVIGTLHPRLDRCSADLS